MGSGTGKETIPDLVRIFRGAFLPSDYKAVEEKLSAREERLNREVEAWRRKYEAMKERVAELETPDDFLAATFESMREDEMARLKAENAELTRRNRSLEDEKAAWSRDLEELEKRMHAVEESIADFADGTGRGCLDSAVQPGESLSKLAREWPCWEQLVFFPPRKVSNSRPAAESLEEGEILEPIDNDEVTPILSNQNGNKSGPEKVNNSNGFLWSDNETENKRRKLRKVEAGSSVFEAARPSSGSLQDTILLEKCQGISNAETKSYNKDAVAFSISKERETFMGRQHKPEVKIREWNFDVEMLGDLYKDDKLCMRAVCALYRHQKLEGGSLKLDRLPRETSLVEFLTDGDPEGRLKKSISELQKFDPHSISHCRKIALDHFKELFEIYQKKDDPFFSIS